MLLGEVPCGIFRRADEESGDMDTLDCFTQRTLALRCDHHPDATQATFPLWSDSCPANPLSGLNKFAAAQTGQLKGCMAAGAFLLAVAD